MKISGSEDRCDGIDGDSDGTIDDGFSPACEQDHKSFLDPSALQGEGGDSVNIIDGNYIRRETDAVLTGPYGSLALSRTYNSRNPSDEANLGVGFWHSFQIYLSQQPSGDDR